jgi:hypothetical protein
MNRPEMSMRRKQITGIAPESEPARNPDLFARQQFKEPLKNVPSTNVVQRSVFNTNNLVVTDKSQLVAQDNPSRSYLVIQNQGIGSIFVNFGQQAGQNIGIEISAGGFYEPVSIPVNSIYMWSSTSVNVYFSEGEPLR